LVVVAANSRLLCSELAATGSASAAARPSASQRRRSRRGALRPGEDLPGDKLLLEQSSDGVTDGEDAWLENTSVPPEACLGSGRSRPWS